LELRFEGLGDSVGTRVDVTGEENGETLLLLGGVRFTKNLDDSLVREPIGNGLCERSSNTVSSIERADIMNRTHSTSLESSTEFSSGDIGSDGSLGNFVDGHVDILIGDVGHHLEGNLNE